MTMLCPARGERGIFLLPDEFRIGGMPPMKYTGIVAALLLASAPCP